MRARQARSAARREQILEAALSCFAEVGTEAADVREISRRAGASLGSIYYQFGNKAGLAAAVYLEGLRHYQGGLITELADSGNAADVVSAIVRYHLRWTENQTTWARFLMSARHAEFMRGHEDDIQRLNRDFGQAVAACVRPHMEAGRLRPLPVDVFLAILLGPCHEYIRGYLSGRKATPIAEAERLLVDAAWRALSGGDT